MRHVSVQQLSAFVDGALVGVSRELVTRHLAQCPVCRQRQAEWSGNDAALRRVLSWEPDERTFEEWSSRVEMTITAERKGLPPPEFSELHHPVIAPASHGPDERRLNSAVESAQRARRDSTSMPAPVLPPAQSLTPPAPPPPAPSSAPQPIAEAQKPAKQKPAAKPKPREPEPVKAVAPPPPPPPAPPPAPISVPLPAALVTPAPELASRPRPVAAAGSAATPVKALPASAPEPITFASPPEPAPSPPPPPAIVASEPPKPAYVPEPEPVTAATRGSGSVPPWSEIALAEPQPTPPSTRLRAYEKAARSTGTTYAPYETGSSRRPLLLALTAILLLVLAGSPLVPEVIRIPLPERWRWRLPRVEFVRHGKLQVPPQITGADMTQLAIRTAPEPELVKQAPIPAPAESTTTPPAAGPVADATADSLAALEQDRDARGSLSIVTPRPSPPKRAKPVKKKRPPPEPEPEVLTWPESPGTFVPTRITTTVTTANEPPVPARTPVLGETAPPRPATPPPAETEEDWPLLCGTVTDAAGAPLEGARVVLPANTLTVRTDHRGRFCVACPPGTHGLRVEASGQQVFTRTVELSTGMLEITIALKPAP